MAAPLTREEYQQRVDLLVAFRAEFGGDPTTSHEYRGVRLGRWLAKQRTAARAGRLADWQQQALDAIGMNWDPKRGPVPGSQHTKLLGDTGWHTRLRQVQEYRAEHGHLPTQDARLADGYRIGVWLSRQRAAAHEGDLALSRYRALEAAGLLETPQHKSLTPARNQVWERYFAALEAYRAAYGTADVPDSHVTGDGLRLGLWVRTQRIKQRGKRLARERERRLSALGVTWRVRVGGHVAHRNWVQRLETYQATFGHIDVPGDYRDSDGAPLGAWLADRREDARRQRLDPDTAAMLRFLALPQRLQVATRRTASRLGMPLVSVLSTFDSKITRKAHDYTPRETADLAA